MKHIRISLYLLLTALLFNACQKEYSNENGNLVVPSGTWQFKDSSKLFIGNMDSATLAFSSQTNMQELHLLGTSTNGLQKFDMQLYADTIQAGTYKASLYQSIFNYTQSIKTIYQANQLIGEFTVVITSFNGTVVSGTFSGAATDSSGTLKQLTEGKFTSTIAGAPPVNASVGVLGDSSGNCKPVTLNGSFQQGVALTSANTVQAQVTVATAGTYTISTNTVNGVTFSGSGTFAAAGPQTVTLKGSGTPANLGNTSFTMSYGNSKCAFNINFMSPATGMLGGGGGNCTPFTLAGIYQQGVLMNSTNTVQIQVTVTAPGSYNITTNTNNGVTFSATGTFAATGLQTVVLNGTGTPVNSGAQSFTVSFGSSNCTFSISFLPGVTPSGDYFPVSANSNWTYGLTGGTPSDSIHFAVINYNPSFGANTYNTIALYDVPPTDAYDSFYYRKPGGDYYQYAIYSNVIPFDQQVSGEFIFLKDNVAVGTTWTSPNISGTFGGVPVTGNIKMTLLYKGAVTINSFNFPDVLEVKYEYMVAGNVAETDQRWFARNVGEVYNSLNDGSTTKEYTIGSYFIF